MGDLNNFLTVAPVGDAPLPGESTLASAVRPTLAGLQWLDVPWAKSSGLAYRINSANVLERLQVTEDGASPAATVVCSYSLSAGAVRIAASPDGRMVAVACCDGSLHCIDSVSSSMSLRWTIKDAHSHVAKDVSSPVSADRSNAAAACGPVMSLDFSPQNYMLMLVDAKKGFAMYDARVVAPTNLTQQQQDLLQNVSYATWCKSMDAQKGTHLAIGRYDGSTAILKYSASSSLLEAVSELGCPTEDDGYCCTHLNWSLETLAVGLCRVIPPEDGTQPDEDEEDDNADHESLLFIATLEEDLALGKASEWMEQGDVAPFWSVPKFARHVFFSSFLRAAEQSLLAVAANLSTDLAIVGKIHSSGEWSPVDFEEGCEANLPTDDDDEFTFPLGISVLQLPSSSFRLLVAATDGSLTTFEYKIINKDDYYHAPVLGTVTDLPEGPVMVLQSAEPEDEKQLPRSGEDGGSWVVVDDSGKKDEASTPDESSPAKAKAPASTTFSSPSTFSSADQSKPASRASTGFSFGQGSKAPVFGSGSAVPTFGSGTFGSGSTTPTFDATSSLGSAFGSGISAPSFGATSPLGSGSTPVTTKSPAMGFGSASTTGGFAALAASNKSGFGTTPSMAPFNAFSTSQEQPKTGFMAKPLFGSSSSSTNQSKPTVDPSRTESKSDESAPAGSTTTSTNESGSPGPAAAPPPASEAYGSKRAAGVFDTFDPDGTGSVPSSSFQDMCDELGEGFHGDEYDAQLRKIDPDNTDTITKSAFVDWYKSLLEPSKKNDDDSLSTGAREDRAEEAAKAKEAFEKTSKTVDGKVCIDADQFEEVIASLGTVYCEEAHRRTIRKLKKDDDLIYESDFVAWYVDWVLCDDEDSDVEDDEDDESGSPPASGNEQGGTNDGTLGDLFKVDAGSWKCDVCTVRNAGNVNKCAACETPRPGSGDSASAGGSAPTAPLAPAPAPSAFAPSAAAAGSSIGPGGFSFGGGGSSGSGKTGFGFGSSTPAPAPAPAPSTGGGFLFGGAKSSDSSATTGFSFGGQQTKAASAPVSTPAAAFPPSSSKAPTPFGGKAPAPASSSSSAAAFPPSSSKAPTPFGGKAPAPASSSSAAFPPSSSKAPSVFGSKSAAPSSSAAFPPSSSKAPTPFGGKSASPAPAATFPPSSSKAPSVFGSKSASPAPAATFPPSSSKAPSVFGSKSAAPSSSAAFPPSSSKAPTPFGGKSASPAPAAAFPPSSSKPPTPFSSPPSKSNATTGVPSSTGASPFSGMSSSTQGQQGAAAKTPSFGSPSFLSNKPPLAQSKTTSSSTAGATTSGASSMPNETRRSSQSKGKPKTREQQEFQGLCESFETTLTRVFDMTSRAAAESQELQDEIEKLQSATQQERAKLLDVDDSLAGRKKEIAFLLSRRTDVSRQIEEAKKLIESVTHDSSASSVVESQPLDRNSEQTRRQIKADMLLIRKDLRTTEWRINLLEKAASDHEGGNTILANEFLGLYYGVLREIPKTLKSIGEKIELASKSIPRSQWQLQKKPQGRSTYSLDAPTPRKRHTMREVQIQIHAATRSRSKMSPKEMVKGWRNMERALQQMDCRTDRFNDLNSGFRRASEQTKKETPRRMAPSSLMSPEVGSVQQSSRLPSSAVSIFSPPSATTARDGWDKPSTVERERMQKSLSASAPRDLKQTTLTEASRPTLSSIGSTPEKLQAALELKNSDFTTRPAAQKSATPAASSSSKKSTSAAAFPPMSSKAPSKPFSATAKSPPKPPAASTKPALTVAALPTSKAAAGSAAFPPASKVAPKAFGDSQASGKSESKGQSADATPLSKKTDSPSMGFGNMAGLADSLNMTSEKPSGATTNSGIPTSETPGSSGGKDYRALFISFYQQMNPSKLEKALNTFDKYKGREEELFAKLKSMYPNFAHLLDGPSGQPQQQGMTSAPAPAPAPASFSGFANSGSAAPPPASSPFTASTNPSPFGPTGGSSGANAGFQPQSPSPFGTSNTSASKSPFSSAPAPAAGGLAASPSPFGAAPAVSSPFGSQAGGLSGASPFGTSAPAPFGTPAPASMQSGPEKLFNGKTARQLLTEIYQQKEPSKLPKVEGNLQKYKGREEDMFTIIAKKYGIDPKLLGISANVAAASPATPFASPTQAQAPAFGQASTMGGGPSPFGQGGGGFGQPSRLGGGAGMSSGAGGGHTFGSAAGSGFGASGFGALAQSSSPSPFGAPSPGFGGGNTGGFGSPAAQGFGLSSGSSPFGPARR